MKLLDVMTSPWAIIPAKLQEIRAVYETHMRGEKIDLNVLKKAGHGTIAENPDDLRGYAIDRGVAVIPVMDVLTKNRTFFSYLFGGTSMRDIGDAFRAAIDDPEVHSILFHIDSPGGTVDGTEELANAIGALRGRKPIMALADGMMASAAYWIGAASERIYVAGETTEMGSIGVVGTHVDVSEQDKMYGEKWTEITAGKYKRMASMHRPLTDEGKSYLQAQVDELYRVFVDSVAAFRGRSVEQVLEAADGKIYLGREAVQNGLADEMATMDEIIQKLKEDQEMNLEEFKTKHSDLYRVVFDEGRVAGASESTETARQEGYAHGQAEGRNEGAETERKRLTEMDAILIPGHEELLAQSKGDPGCSAADFSIRQAKAEKEIRKTELDKLKADAILPALHAAPPDNGPPAISSLPIDERAKAEWDKSPNIRAEFGGDGNFNSYLAYLKHAEAGLVRILGQK